LKSRLQSSRKAFTRNKRTPDERATHAVPGIRPQSYSVHGYVVPGGTFQEAALLMLINEIGAMASFILMLTAILTKIPFEPFR